MADHIIIQLNGQPVEAAHNSTLATLLQKHPHHIPVMGALVNNEIRDLTYALENSCTVEWLDLSTADGLRIYIRGLSFVFVRAVRELHPEARAMIEHSLSNGLYCEVKGMKSGKPLTPREVAAIQKRMEAIVAADEPFVKKTTSKDDAIAMFARDGQMDKALLLPYRPFTHFDYYESGDTRDYYYGYMPPSTGYIASFKLHPYLPGLVLLHPQRSAPLDTPTFVEMPKLAKVFKQAEDWSRIVGCSTVGDLNTMIDQNRVREIMCVAEALHEKSIAEIADQICTGHSRLVLIAGPSSSGKTTFAHRLMVQLRVNGRRPIAISLDDYYLDRDQAPRDEFGNLDFEDIRALDVELFNEQLSALLQGDSVHLPKFDFTVGKGKPREQALSIDDDQIIVVEGIHGLNEAMTSIIPADSKFGIYISALTQLNVDDHNRIPTTDSRLIRRIVRDHQFRNASAEVTMSMWGSVRRGEEKYIFPYQEKADVMFNSALVYELAILKKHIMPLLLDIRQDSEYFTEAKRLRKFLNYITSLEGEAMIPPTSILREFIGGCIFYD